jgi:hypothetical protein
MDSYLPELLSEACGRPRHFFVERWYDRPVGGGVTGQISYRNEPEDVVFKKRKANRRLELWHKPFDKGFQTAPSSGKLAEAKRQRFTTEGKQERVSKSLAALNQQSYIRLTSEEWRLIVEDSDLEDQS